MYATYTDKDSLNGYLHYCACSHSFYVTNSQFFANLETYNSQNLNSQKNLTEFFSRQELIHRCQQTAPGFRSQAGSLLKFAAVMMTAGALFATARDHQCQ
jgi:hypothetical protein